ncbi:MAG: hypothetical protein ABIP48_28880, partial [Planctomycetota bacterium]
MYTTDIQLGRETLANPKGMIMMNGPDYMTGPYFNWVGENKVSASLVGGPQTRIPEPFVLYGYPGDMDSFKISGAEYHAVLPDGRSQLYSRVMDKNENPIANIDVTFDVEESYAGPGRYSIVPRAPECTFHDYDTRMMQDTPPFVDKSLVGHYATLTNADITVNTYSEAKQSQPFSILQEPHTTKTAFWGDANLGVFGSNMLAVFTYINAKAEYESNVKWLKETPSPPPLDAYWGLFKVDGRFLIRTTATTSWGGHYKDSFARVGQEPVRRYGLVGQDDAIAFNIYLTEITYHGSFVYNTDSYCIDYASAQGEVPLEVVPNVFDEWAVKFNIWPKEMINNTLAFPPDEGLAYAVGDTVFANRLTFDFKDPGYAIHQELSATVGMLIQQPEGSGNLSWAPVSWPVSWYETGKHSSDEMNFEVTLLDIVIGQTQSNILPAIPVIGGRTANDAEIPISIVSPEGYEIKEVECRIVLPGNPPEWDYVLLTLPIYPYPDAASNTSIDRRTGLVTSSYVSRIPAGTRSFRLEDGYVRVSVNRLRPSAVHSSPKLLNLLVIDIDVDTNMDGDLDNDDHRETEKRGLILYVNNDSDAGGGAIDNQNSVIDGAVDKNDMKELIIRKMDSLPNNWAVNLRVSEKNRIRIFNESDVAIIGPDAVIGGPGIDDASIPRNQILSGDLVYLIEGVDVGHVIMRLVVLDSNGNEVDADEVRVVVNVDRKPEDPDPKKAGYRTVNNYVGAYHPLVGVEGVEAMLEGNRPPISWGKPREL